MDEAVRQLEGLYQAHGPALLVYLRRLTRRVDVADDLLHETFVQALRSIDRMADLVSPRAWLFTVARNVAVSSLRRKQIVTGLSESLPAAGARVEDPKIEQMRGAIAQLPEKLREALELRLRDELTYEEISAVLEIPVGTVRSRLHHAVRQLREAMVGQTGCAGETPVPVK